ncbi:M20 aminoacylase family protein [Fodinicurvata sp. EGI_FJ10296]|uniref:M20 aminoacylase family protein n=1 Tax=Fodinicurvata sp. EGI_FJ10296 TaxID=3231908 RepID=UPI003453C06C
MPVYNSLAALKPTMTEWRRDIHAHPETAFEEVRTSAKVADLLESWGIEVHRGIAGTGVVGVLAGSGGGKRAIGLRADMDALPMQEVNEFAHKSTIPGKMHGCGHDGHTSMLLGAAKYLSETRNFDGVVHFIFQPGEEGAAGARVMIEDGLFDRFPCDEVYALHNWPQLPQGTVGVKTGPMMAATGSFDLTVNARGGHAAMPHQSIDPIVIASQIITAWQALVSRTVDPLDNAVLSVTQVHAGSAYNVIPTNATMCGTVRTFREPVQDALSEKMGALAEGIAGGYGATVSFSFRKGYPATINADEQTAKIGRVAAEVVGEENIDGTILPSMGGEDFAYMLEKVPGAYIWVGQGGGPSACNVHNPGYDFNDDILPIGASILARMVETELPKGAK